MHLTVDAICPAAACQVAGWNFTRAEWSQYLPDGKPCRASCPRFPT